MTVPLNTIFTVASGSKLDFNKMKISTKADGGVNFVGRASENHGVSGIVERVDRLAPYPAGLITVALGGSKLLASFIQAEEFYTAQNVAVLQPKKSMTMAEKLFICLCIRHNRFKYTAFGREANRTLRTLLVPSPEDFPAWLKSVSVKEISKDYSPAANSFPIGGLGVAGWAKFALKDLFHIKKGIRLTKDKMSPGTTPFISAIESNNGVRQKISARPSHEAGLITVNYNGGVAEAFYQPRPFFASDDVNILYPRFEIDELTALFLCSVIRREKYRFNYGRKWTLERMNASSISLPSDQNGKPDWQRIRDIMSRLPYSGSVTLPAASSQPIPG